MSNVVQVKTEDVTTALKYFVDMSMALSVDADGYVYSVVDPDHKRIKIGSREQEKPLVVYKEVIPKDDVHVLNPFAEGLGDRTPPQIFFYKIMRAALNARLSYAIDGVVSCALEQQKQAAPPTAKKGKDSAAAEQPRVPLRLVRILAAKVVDDRTVLDEVDEKMLGEFHKFFDQNGDRVIEPVYKPSMQRTDVLVSVIMDAGFVATLHNIRKKSIAVLQTVIREIFGLTADDTFEKFSSKRIEGAPSKLSSWLQTIYQLYRPINEVVDVLDDVAAPDHLVNLDIYQFHLENLAAYTNNAKWMMVSSPSSPAPAVSTTPAFLQNQLPGTTPGTLVPSPPTLNVSSTASSGSTTPPGYKLVPGPLMPDGTVGAPRLIPDYGAQQPGVMQPQMAPIYPDSRVNPGWQQQGYYPQGQQQPMGWYQNTQPGMMPNQQSMMYPGGMQPNPFFAAAQQPVLGPYNQGMVGGYNTIPGMPPLR